MTTQAVQESLSGAHAPMSKVFPGKITTTVGTRNAYVQSDGDVVVMCVGEDAEERAKTVARAIASHDKLVAMGRLLQPAFGVDGVRFTITPDSFNRLESLLRPSPVLDRKLSNEELQELIAAGASEVVFMSSTDDDYSAEFPSTEISRQPPYSGYTVDDICFTIGAAIRRRNRSLTRTEQPIAPSCELAATDLVLKALAECGYKVSPPQQAAAEDLCSTALAEIVAECDKVQAALKDTGHAHEGASLSALVWGAIDRERSLRHEEVQRYRRFVVAIREAHSSLNLAA
ncbi:hypothetical protein [Mesorhizobium sp. M6A.T.Cr.TU.016.01.1.1]|uniref:hypothetical protein n=1 Tax=Mesorhizobium sp. M6A.T.Cr.TU.016.01.1.1 TaxID=2493677 RepID=UPI000F74CA0D|nr:hypothetical protein [Mesorhizobium sp. M6A.T.Cr.TU.016.01.1.1]AZO67664.1 hypothetical protein EJ075_23910 [Mesorhizobium sp. M6A.T.Cr.TU.016.01.1.1]